MVRKQVTSNVNARLALLLAVSYGLLAVWVPASHAAQSSSVSDAIAWYDTLGYPDATGLRYVRVATGSWTQAENQPRRNQFVEGFLLREDAASFTVFLCNVSEFKKPFDEDDFPSKPYWPLTTVRFVRRPSGPDYQQIGYEVLDFRSVAYAVLDRVQQQPVSPGLIDFFMVPATHRARIFAFARACLQKGFSDVCATLMDIAANIPVGQTGKVEPTRLRELLQQQIGDAVLAHAEVDAGDPTISWTDLLSEYVDFDLRFPASDRIPYARESADVLRRMIAEDSNHHPKPLEQMSPVEQAAEYIYQLRNWKGHFYWIQDNRHPAQATDGQQTSFPVNLLSDLGNEAVPQLIEALDDHSFTKSMAPSFNGTELPKDMRVSDFAQGILQSMSGRNFFPRKIDGKVLTTRQQAEAWWAEAQK